MKLVKILIASASMMALFPSHAFAFDFGFVRVPGWMDPYIGSLFIAFCVGFLGLSVTKPRGVPFNQLPNVKISPLANFFRYFSLITLLLLMLMVFVGMGLQRAVEAGA